MKEAVKPGNFIFSTIDLAEDSRFLKSSQFLLVDALINVNDWWRYYFQYGVIIAKFWHKTAYLWFGEKYCNWWTCFALFYFHYLYLISSDQFIYKKWYDLPLATHTAHKFSNLFYWISINIVLAKMW